VSKRSKQGSEAPPWKLLLWTAIAGVIFGLIGFGDIAEDWLRVARNSFHPHKTSGQVVVIKIDDQALRQYGNWPWPRRHHALLVDRLTAAGVRGIFYDINFSYPSNPVDDGAFAQSLKRSGMVTLAARFKSGPLEGKKLESQPLPQFTSNSKIATLSVEYNWQNAVWKLPYAVVIGGKPVPSFAAAIAGR